ncbi:DUF2000 family protein [Mycolicibacterium sp.]|uniref:DUF2000 family protein n=1 Tax=Mycolicibacterium sp. TaxID=2320850 RepID=UPI003D0C881A
MTDQLTEEADVMTNDVRITTKIALVVRADLQDWQKLNLTAFLASGVAASAPDAIGRDYADADGTRYTPMFGEPVMVYAADPAKLTRTLNRALSRDVVATVFTMELFGTPHDAANRAAVAAHPRDSLDLAGLAVRADRKTVDKIVDGLRLHP